MLEEAAIHHTARMQYVVHRSAGGGYSVEAVYDLPAERPLRHSESKEESAAIYAKAASMVESGYGATDDERAYLRTLYAVANALSLADEDCLGRSREGLTR